MKTFFVWTLLIFFGCMPAYADFEALETVLGKLEDVQKEAQNVQEKLKTVESKLNAIRQGDFGQLADISSSIPNIGKVDVKLLDSVSDKVGNLKDLEGAFTGNIIPEYTDTDQTATYIEVKNAAEAARRESLSRLYAYALTLRTNMEKDRTEGGAQEETVTAENSREILQSAATKEAMENARRISHIWDMQASIDELRLLEMAQRYSSKAEESGETEGEK